MVKKFKPIIYTEYDHWDELNYHYPKMEESPLGQYVELQTYQHNLDEMNKLKKKLERYQRRLDLLEGRAKS